MKTTMWTLVVLMLLLTIAVGPGSAFVSNPTSSKTKHRAAALYDAKGPLTHEDIVWKIRPPPTATRRQRLKWKVLANLLRWESLVRFQKPPTVLCPNNFPSIVLEAHTRGLRGKKIGRFGITCTRGPSAPLIGETVQGLYSIGANMGPSLGIAAIIFMVVEPEFRGRDVGKLSLEVISLIHARINADFTIAVADDKSEERKLVQWYEQQGYAQAPLLQEMMGSPNEKFGVSMIAPTNGNHIPEGCRIQWW